MTQALERTIQLTHFGDADGLQIVDMPLPVPGPGEVRVRVLSSSLNYTDVLIRKHLYPQTAARQVPFVMGYDVVGEIDELGPFVEDFRIGERVADMTVVGSNADYRILRASDLTRVPDGVDPAEAATLILSWTTAYQMLRRSARVQPGQKILIHGAAGAVGQAQIQLGKLAGFQMWGGARGAQTALVRELGATPVDYDREDFTKVVPGGFDVVFDGIGEDGYRRSFAALRPGGLLVAIGFSANVQAKQGMLRILATIGRMYVWGLLPGGKRTHFYSINVMRARHPEWFKEDLAHLFELLKQGTIHPRVAERISFDAVADAHRRLEAGGLEGKIVLCPELA
jgi:NADPH:quinone reductase-like Zn-dependent oxidoreductase